MTPFLGQGDRSISIRNMNLIPEMHAIECVPWVYLWLIHYWFTGLAICQLNIYLYELNIVKQLADIIRPATYTNETRMIPKYY